MGTCWLCIRSGLRRRAKSAVRFARVKASSPLIASPSRPENRGWLTSTLHPSKTCSLAWLSILALISVTSHSLRPCSSLRTNRSGRLVSGLLNAVQELQSIANRNPRICSTHLWCLILVISWPELDGRWEVTHPQIACLRRMSCRLLTSADRLGAQSHPTIRLRLLHTHPQVYPSLLQS